MDSNKGQTIFLSVIGIATLLVAIIGATFAWFSVTVQGNDQASSIIVTTAVLGSVVFTDGNVIDLSNIQPGANATKTFTVSNTTSGVTEDYSYDIYLNITANTLSAAADGQFVHSLSGTKNGSGTLVTVAEAAVPTATTKLGTGVLAGTETHTYTYNISFKNTDSNQNAAQGKTFSGALSVVATP